MRLWCEPSHAHAYLSLRRVASDEVSWERVTPPLGLAFGADGVLFELEFLNAVAQLALDVPPVELTIADFKHGAAATIELPFALLQ